MIQLLKNIQAWIIAAVNHLLGLPAFIMVSLAGLTATITSWILTGNFNFISFIFNPFNTPLNQVRTYIEDYVYEIPVIGTSYAIYDQVIGIDFTTGVLAIYASCLISAIGTKIAIKLIPFIK